MRLKGVLTGAVSAALISWAPNAMAGELPVETVPIGGTFVQPVFAVGAPGDPDLVYVVEQGGTVQAVDDGNTLPKPFLDITDGITAGGEKGLLSIAFPEDHEETGLFYAYFTNQTCNEGIGACDIEVAEFKLKGGDPTDAKEGSRRTVLTIPHQDAGNHNGGTAMFGPDGKLWLATGDGGGGNDAFDNASRKGKLLGKLLRINPKKPTKKSLKKARKNAPRGYRVPKKNPFVGVRGRDEIWSVGLRNPFRFSFDGEVIAIGDVGQNQKEELDIVSIGTAKGADFGWPAREGDISGPHPDRTTGLPLIEPIHTYPRPVDPPDNIFRGVSVTGGVFVRDPRLAGTAFDPANDRYLFGEAFTSPQVRSLLPDVDGQEFADLRSHNFNLPQVVGFGEDALARVYIVSRAGPNGGTVNRLDPASDPPRDTAAHGEPPVGDGKGSVDLVQVGGSFDAPVNSAFAPGEESNAYVVEQGGKARVVAAGSTQPQPFLDVTDLTESSGEQGFLSMTFHPGFAENGLVYAYYTDEDNGDIVVSEFETISPLDADESSRREVIRIKHRFASNHNGGHIAFGPDGFLYISTGDGGDANDPREKAQNKQSLLGKLLRIDPTPAGGVGPSGYAVPPSNPFVGKKGADEVYASGLRNPFRMNFDPETEWLAIGDVGQDRFEEVDMESAATLRGANFGWDRYEGFKKVKTGDTAKTPRKGKHSKPTLAYSHDAGASVIGGLVVRDPDLANLVGRYLFADFYRDDLRSFEPSLGKVKKYVSLNNEVNAISSFSQDPVTREVYVTSRGDEALYRLEPAAP